jgi:hypothetical protein
MPGYITDLCGADMRTGGSIRLKADGFAAVANEGLDECPVACSDVEDWTWRQNAIQAAGECATHTAKYRISQTGEPAARRAVPAFICLTKLRVAWPRRCRRHAAYDTPDPAALVVVVGTEMVVAPGALGGGQLRCARRGNGCG